jgi:small subunit ribosomal protein S20
VITSRKAQIVNRDVRTEIRSGLKKIRQATTKTEVSKELPNMFTLLDKAARRNQGGITKNAASNYKRKIHQALARAK